MLRQYRGGRERERSMPYLKNGIGPMYFIGAHTIGSRDWRALTVGSFYSDPPHAAEVIHKYLNLNRLEIGLQFSCQFVFFICRSQNRDFFAGKSLPVMPSEMKRLKQGEHH
jgi:hypothetical protein